VFGSSGSGNFLVKATTIAATIFFVTSLSLAIFARGQAGGSAAQGMPVVNEALIEEQQNDAPSDVPQIEADQAPVDAGDDIPALPDAGN